MRKAAADPLATCDTISFGDTRVAPFIGAGNIWIVDNYDQRSLDLARYLILRALCDTGSNQLHVTGYDESLSGLFAPFSSLTEDETRLIDLLEDQHKLEEHLSYLLHQVRAIQNKIRGLYPTLSAYRRAAGRPIEQYQLVVLHVRSLDEFDARLRADLIRLMRRGPDVGLTFLVVGNDPGGAARALYPRCFFVDRDLARSLDGMLAGFDARKIVRACETLKPTGQAETTDTTDRSVIGFEETHIREDEDRVYYWRERSTDGLRITVGMFGDEPYTFTLGDNRNQRHNILITGAVGQGKSNLLSVIIHSLCWNYGPTELELYLLDFKEGVTFKPYANIGRESYLPHARAIGLESDVEFGIAVLDELHREYLRRMRTLKEHDARSIYELRTKYPELVMSRIVVIIDEFQLMVDDGMREHDVAGQLERAVRLYRAAGIHFILSSQTLASSNVQLAQRRDAIFGQVPIRIALKNSLSESYSTLANDNPAAAHLRPRDAIVNLNYGAVDNNKTVSVAYADEDCLRERREEWWRFAKEDGVAREPYVYENDRAALLDEDEIAYLRAQDAPTVSLGRRISVTGERMTLPFGDDQGKNLAIIGDQDGEHQAAVGVLQAAALSIAARTTPEAARFLFCDFKGTETSYAERYPRFCALMRELGHTAQDLARADFEATLQALADEAHPLPTYVLAANLDGWAPTTEGFRDNALKALAKRGPSRGCHLIGWWVREANFQAHAGMAGDDPFNAKVFLRVGEDDIKHYIGYGATWQPRPNRALATDKVELGDNVTFAPFVPIDVHDETGLASSGWEG